MRIVTVDLESYPIVGEVWRTREADVIRIIHDWHLLCISYKWLDEKKVHNVALPDFPLYKKDKRNDKHITKHIRNVLDEADVVIGHNLDKFDLRKINAKCIIHGILPPSPYRTIDTLKVVRRVGSFTSNRLDSVAKDLGIGIKKQTGGYDLWKKCGEKDPKAWKKMIEYCDWDVALTEKVYLRVLPWIKNHPNRGAWNPKMSCPNCGQTKLQKAGFHPKGLGKYQSYRCLRCGARPIHWKNLLEHKIELR